MPSIPNHLFITLLGISLILTLPSVHSAKLYRWYDEDGKVFFSDKVPPEHAKHKRESLTEEAQVIKKETVEAARDKEQIAMELRLNALRNQRQKIIRKQKAHDRVLRLTYRNVEEMELALARNTQSFEIQASNISNNLERLKLQLQQLQKIAANHERTGIKVTEETLNQIHQTEKEIIQTKTSIANINERKTVELNKFKADIERFKFLTSPAVVNKTVVDEKTDINAAKTLGLYRCNSPEECHKAWSLAKQFIQKHSSTAIELETDELIMTSSPITDQDLSLSLSKMTKRNQKPQIFLDIRCRESAKGKALCTGDKSKQIRTAFRPYIVSNLAIQ